MYRIVHTINAPWPPSTWFDCDEETGLCVKIKVHTMDGRVVSQYDDGFPLAIPLSAVLPWTVGVGVKGLEVAGQRRA